MTANEAAEPISGPTTADQAREQLINGLYQRIHHSVQRRTPFMSKAAADELAEDVVENVSAFLREALAL